MNKIIIAFLFATVFSGCTNNKSENIETSSTKTVIWYESHSKERAETLQKCFENPGELEDTPNCENARQAEIQASIGELPKF